MVSGKFETVCPVSFLRLSMFSTQCALGTPGLLLGHIIGRIEYLFQEKTYGSRLI